MNSTPIHSGGPRTAEGKAISRRNALKHGGRASTLISHLAGEEHFEELRASLAAECCPVGPREEQLADLLAQYAVQAGFTGLQLRAAVRDVTRTCREMCGTGTGEADDAALRMSVEAPAVMLATRYNASANAGFVRTLALLHQLQEERRALPRAPLVIADHRVCDSGQIPSSLARLRDIVADGERRPLFLWELYCRHGDPGILPEAPLPPFDAVMLTAALSTTFLAKTGLEPQVALVFAAECISAPETPVSALSSRAGLRRRATALKLRDRLRPSGEASRDWVLRGLEVYLRSA